MDNQVKMAMLHQDIIVYKASSTSGCGDTTFGDPITLKGYQTGKRIYVVTLEGGKVLSTVQIFLDSADFDNLNSHDEIQPQGYIERFPILKLEPFYKERGILDYGIVYLG